MQFTVVIPTYNRAATLRRCLAAVSAQTWQGHDIIVVDDGSTDGTPASVAADFPDVGYIRQDNRGPAAARNAGVRAAQGSIIAFTDDDCVPPPDWLAQLAAGFERHPETAGVGGAMLAPEAVRQANLLARYEAYVTQVIYGAGDQEVLGGLACPAGGTNNMAYRRTVLEAIGGFDESFRYAAGEDADLKWRLTQAGHRVLYVPVTVTHLQPYTWDAFRRQQFVRGKGRLMFDQRRGRRTGYVLVAARFAAGLVRLPARTISGLRWPALNDLWYNTLGQWAALRELRR